jgi:hypothetical protein
LLHGEDIRASGRVVKRARNVSKPIDNSRGLG